MTIWPQKSRNTTKNEAAPWRSLLLFNLEKIPNHKGSRTLLHGHIARDAIGKNNHCLGTHNTGTLLHPAVKQLHEMLIVVRVHLCQN